MTNFINENAKNNFTAVLTAVLFATGLLLVSFHQHPHQESHLQSETGQSLHTVDDSEICFICTIPIQVHPVETATADVLILPEKQAEIQGEVIISTTITDQFRSRAPPFSV